MTGRDRYPRTWKRLASEAKERAGWVCEDCQVMHGTLVCSPRTGNRYIIYLQAAHLDHDPCNEHPELRAVCPSCHARYYRRPRYRPVSPLICTRLRSWGRQQASTQKRPSAQLEPGQRGRNS